MNTPLSLKIITTGDGSPSLWREDLNETYHSIHGAIQESLHVFIKHGLEYIIHQNISKSISILEIGFGTGLNALLTLQRVEKLQKKIKYTTVEAWPLTEEIWSALSYSNSPELINYYVEIHRARWDVEHHLNAKFNLLKLLKTVETVELPISAYDLVYYDAFAPSKQPELWELSVFEKISKAMKTGGIFVTYSAKGQLKRDLGKVGLRVETLSGPPGKKEMVRAIKL